MLNPDLYRLLVRPLLFRLPPETAQRVAEAALRTRLLWRALSPAFKTRNSRLEVDLCGIRLANPVGLAAGYDKNCEFLPSLAALGFGYLMGGTVTQFPRPGNPKPRVIRYARKQSLINSLGFPGKGVEFAAKRLERARGSIGDTPIVVSVSGTTVDEIVMCHRRLEPLANAVEVNISSPNTAGLRVFQEPTALADLLGRVNDGRKKPLFVKLPPFGAPDRAFDGLAAAGDGVLELARVCVRQGVEGLTVANTRPAEEPRLAVGSGGLSGKLVFPDMLRMVADVRAQVGDGVAINATGGVFSGEDAWAAIQAGASTVQVLTGLIYVGPWIAGRIGRELLRIMGREDVASLGR